MRIDSTDNMLWVRNFGVMQQNKSLTSQVTDKYNCYIYITCYKT